MRALGPAGVALVFLATVSSAAWSQNAEALYQAGAFRLAADSFAARAEAAPGIPTNWYNLGNALYRAGDHTAARVAWVRAARALPRSPDIRRALDLVEAPDPTSAAATSVRSSRRAKSWLSRVGCGCWDGRWRHSGGRCDMWCRC